MGRGNVRLAPHGGARIGGIGGVGSSGALRAVCSTASETNVIHPGGGSHRLGKFGAGHRGAVFSAGDRDGRGDSGPHKYRHKDSGQQCSRRGWANGAPRLPDEL
jgi:hypothetical protein